MKKYKIMIAAVSLFYLVLAFFAFFGIQRLYSGSEDAYKVEVNRTYATAAGVYEDKGRLDEKDLLDLVTDEDQVKEVTYLRMDADKDEIESFYKDKNRRNLLVRPLWMDNKLVGYLGFSYENHRDAKNICFFVEVVLAILYFVVLSGFIYVGNKIIRPFATLSDLPYELSKGNLRGDIEESKNRYFGKFLWGIGMLKDTLEVHKKQELKLAKEKKMILLAVSHDIKTPLNAIKLYARALREGIYSTQEEIVQAAENIENRTEEINAFVIEIVRSSTQDVVAIDVKMGEFYLKELVEKIRVGYSEKWKRQKTEFTIGEYENYLLSGDEDKLYEAIGNFMENASKYGDGKKIHVSFAREEYCVLISVFNSGVPVEEKDMVHLFESFYRGSNTNGKQGNGLGLYICNEIMNKMNGDIFARRHDDGMEFVLVCPIS